eukprot:1342464-Pleurochrysis_carterae.AAC.1
MSGGRRGAKGSTLSDGGGGAFGGVSMLARGSWARSDWTTSVATARVSSDCLSTRSESSLT